MIEYLGQPGIGSVMPALEADYVRVANALRSTIRAAGTLRLGDLEWTLTAGAKLPTKVQLAEIYDVSLNAIDRAMIVLRTEEYVIGHQGRAVYVAEGRPSPD
jgi:DNA-binding GntR family transcriptional regulator